MGEGISLIAYITLDSNRVIGGNPLILYSKSESEAKELSVDIAKSMKCDVIKMKCGDYLLVKYN